MLPIRKSALCPFGNFQITVSSSKLHRILQETSFAPHETTSWFPIREKAQLRFLSRLLSVAQWLAPVFRSLVLTKVDVLPRTRGDKPQVHLPCDEKSRWCHMRCRPGCRQVSTRRNKYIDKVSRSLPSGDGKKPSAADRQTLSWGLCRAGNTVCTTWCHSLMAHQRKAHLIEMSLILKGTRSISQDLGMVPCICSAPSVGVEERYSPCALKSIPSGEFN